MRRIAPLVALVVALSACGSEGLDLREWTAAWDSTVERVTQDFGQPLTQEGCEDTLAYLREQRVALEPTPIGDLEDPVSAWLDLAEDLAFECETHDGPDRLAVIADEVQLVLDAEG